MSFDRIPLSMREGRFWVNWRLESVADNRTTKRPYNSRTGQLASVTNPFDWSSFDEACHAAAQPGAYSGIGYVFSKMGKPGDPTWNRESGVDCDNPFDGSLPEAEAYATYERQVQIVNWLDSYTELSQSGKGVHVIVNAVVPDGRRRDKVELYSHGRFFAMTGNVWQFDRPIVDAQFKAEELWKQLKASELREVAESRQQSLSDQELIDKALSAANGDKLDNLLKGNWSLYYPSQSEGDLALIDIVNFWSMNAEQTERIFRASGMFRQEKQHHIKGMVQKSFDKIPALPDIPALQAEIELYRSNIPSSSNGRIPAFEAVNLGSTPSDGTILNPYDTLPPGLMGELARFVYHASIKPNPALSIAAAIALMAGICGRSYNVSGTGANLYLLAMASTGMGKEGMAQGIGRLINACVVRGAMTAPEIIGPAEIASGQALTKHLSAKPFFLSILPEFGIRLGTITSSRASGPERMLYRALLDLFNKSGQGDIMRGAIYSDRDKNVADVAAPALSILAETTQETLFKHLSEESINSGLISRFIYLEAKGDVPPSNTARLTEPDANLTDRLKELIVYSFHLNHKSEVCNCVMDKDAFAYQAEFDEFCRSQINNSGNEISRQLWNRSHLQLLKLGALIAAGCNYLNPTITRPMLEWAKAIIVHSVGIMLSRFEAGEMGGNEGADNAAQIKAMETAFREFYSKAVIGYGLPPVWKESNIVPYAYLSRKLIKLAVFKNDRRSATTAIDATLKTMQSMGLITELSHGETMKRVGLSQRSFILSNLDMLRV